jgi:hypothetical protein
MEIEYKNELPEQVITWVEMRKDIKSIGKEAAAKKYFKFTTSTAKESGLPLSNSQIDLWYSDIYTDFYKILCELEVDMAKQDKRCELCGWVTCQCKPWNITNTNN